MFRQYNLLKGDQNPSQPVHPTWITTTNDKGTHIYFGQQYILFVPHLIILIEYSTLNIKTV